MDTTTDPCVNFAKYACGNFNARYPLSPEQVSTTPSNMASDHIAAVLKSILEKDALLPSPTSSEKLLGNYYAACLDVKNLDARGLAPLQPLLHSIDEFQNKRQLPGLLAQLQRVGVDGFFRVYAIADDKDATRIVATLDQSGLGLPSREDYDSHGAPQETLRDKYKNHIERLLRLSGMTEAESHAAAQDILKLETALAMETPDPVQRRDPEARYHLLPMADVERMTPSFAWKEFFAHTGANGVDRANVWSPQYIRVVGRLMSEENIASIRSYLRWRVLSTIPGVDLPTEVDEERFSFEGKELQGRLKQASRDRRCQSSVTSDLTGPVAAAVIPKLFSKEEISSVVDIAREIETALSRDIDALPWMDDKTKTLAKLKVASITNNIVTLDPWEGWSKLTVTRDDALGNYLKAARIENERTFAKIGLRSDRNELAMSPTYTGAYWTNARLSMNVNAGMMLPPFYDPRATDAVNFGHLGSAIGHEVTHGFDNSGAKYDASGNLENWWTDADKRQFEERSSCFVEEYSAFSEGDLHVNGKLTLGENIADNGGLRLAYMAMLQDAKEKGIGLETRSDGFTPEQQFFIGFGQEYCGSSRPQHDRTLMLTDVHSLDQFRVNGVVQNMPEFGRAFSCKVGQPMMPAKTCRLW